MPPWQGPGTAPPPPPGPAGDAAPPPPPWQSSQPAPVWAPGTGAPLGPGAAAPSVTTSTWGSSAAPAADPYAGIDPFRTDGTSLLRPPPTVPGAQYRLDAPTGAWGPPPVWAPPPRTDGLAVASLVLGILGLLVFPLVLSQVALVLGIVGMRRVRRSGDQGFGMAVAGIVLGSLGTLGVLLLLGFFASIAWWGV